MPIYELHIDGHADAYTVNADRVNESGGSIVFSNGGEEGEAPFEIQAVVPVAKLELARILNG